MPSGGGFQIWRREMSNGSIEQLRDELRQIDDLARLTEQERDAERGINALRYKLASAPTR
jgi:hypothetical protein